MPPSSVGLEGNLCGGAGNELGTPSSSESHHAIGRYYAVVDMLTTDPKEKYGKTTLREHYQRVATEGQEQVAATGFISQDVSAVRPENTASLPSEIRQRVEGAYRLSVNFRFKDGSARLDNKAQRDVERLVKYLSNNPDADVMLFGYASESDDLNRAHQLSKHRAMAVSRALKQEAVYPDEIDGFGAEAPLARIEGNDGRQKNSRVEVWIRPPHSIAEAL